MAQHAVPDDPDTLLTAEQAADLLGIQPATLRAYASRGQAPEGRKVGNGRRWTLREIEDHRNPPPGTTPRRRGRPRGATDTSPRKPSLAARRAAEIAAREATGDTLTTEQVMATYDVTERTAQRLLQRARNAK
ncbi:helix-turn-helix domain-containing protein [Streptomyces sp. 549]|uniref:helix-turn-helix transcriptional regulator n=1 Tax=Streptomyces sp. 549 TaxID=3049076 RepID=UPI0024C3925A|nr:helix-turn-helix domain-containing protein [Streptomyces sp. 549]MDK1476833.1 helix-turn-helix domain-containing protein [Streptomyces sp. 549]